MPKHILLIRDNKHYMYSTHVPLAVQNTSFSSHHKYTSVPILSCLVYTWVMVYTWALILQVQLWRFRSHCTYCTYTLPFLPYFQTGVQVVPTDSQDQLWRGYCWLPHHHVHTLWPQHASAHQATGGHGFWSASTVLWSVLRSGEPRLCRSLC